MRLFVALDFNEHHDYLSELQGVFTPTVRASFPRSFHLTLIFLGEVPESQLDQTKESLENTDFQSFRLRLGSMGVFPSAQSPRVLWVGVQPVEQITALQKQVEGSLAGMFPPDPRFHPHVTLARVRYVKDREALKKALSHLVEPKEIDVSSFELIKSVLTPQGPLYETIARISAKGL
jgi:2'-5' RNA ligase